MGAAPQQTAQGGNRTDLRAIGSALADSRCNLGLRLHQLSRRLAVLLPARPAAALIRYLVSCHVVCVWETGTGRFADSARGVASLDIRRDAIKV